MNFPKSKKGDEALMTLMIDIRKMLNQQKDSKHNINFSQLRHSSLQVAFYKLRRKMKM